MTIFTRTWNAAYEASPANSQDAAQGAERIREFKVDTRERLEVDHSHAGDANDGAHKKVTFVEQVAAPGVVADTGYLYTKDVSGATELFWLDAAGNEVQLTDGGNLKGSGIWESTQYTPAVALVDGATVTPNMNSGSVFTWTIAGNRTLANPTNAAAGMSMIIEITQDGTGGRTITFGSAYKFASGQPKTLSTTAGDVDVLTAVFTGTFWRCSLMKDVSS